MPKEIVFVIPVFNDWESAVKLLQEIEKVIPERSALFLLVNDSSHQVPDLFAFSELRNPVNIIELSHNMGHQKAIAAGLAYANENCVTEYLIVMDSDGEDQPLDIPRLLTQAAESKQVVFAKRFKRSEGLLFRLFYKLYKFIFVLLTGKKISFGNYCVIPQAHLRKMVHVPEIWNHFSGGVIRSGIPYTAVPTQRGKRYYGQSKMNFTRLILHGLSAVSVYADFMAIRLILFSLFLIIVTVAGILGVAFVRLFTRLAIPGWATFTVLGLGILLFLALLLGLFLLFNILTMKTQKTIIPAKDYADYIIDIKKAGAHE
ncbi:MAG: glycosyltransferase [Chitinophagaceae bacterium]|nr:glycosyltransferase [Chitinophagaceae bacterium]